MRNRQALLAYFLLCFWPSLAADTKVDQYLKGIDDRVNFIGQDFSAEYEITQNKPGEGATTTKTMVFRRDSKSQYLVLLVEPVEDRGKGYLLVEGGLWLYDPRDRRFTFTSAQDAFRNTNARNSDFAISELANHYRVLSRTKVQLGAFECDRVDLSATTAEAPFPRKTIWVSVSDNILRMSQEYSLSGLLLRTVAYQYQRWQGRDVPSKILIVDELRKKTIGGKEEKETTSIVIRKPSFEALPSGLFTKEYLERMGK